MPKIALVSPANVEESRAKRQERTQNRFRDRGGIFVPTKRDGLLNILMSKPQRRSRSRSRSRSQSPSKLLRASSRSISRSPERVSSTRHGTISVDKPRKSSRKSLASSSVVKTPKAKSKKTSSKATKGDKVAKTTSKKSAPTRPKGKEKLPALPAILEANEDIENGSENDAVDTDFNLRRSPRKAKSSKGKSKAVTGDPEGSSLRTAETLVSLGNTEPSGSSLRRLARRQEDDSGERDEGYTKAPDTTLDHARDSRGPMSQELSTKPDSSTVRKKRGRPKKMELSSATNNLLIVPADEAEHEREESSKETKNRPRAKRGRPKRATEADLCDPTQADAVSDADKAVAAPSKRKRLESKEEDSTPVKRTRMSPPPRNNHSHIEAHKDKITDKSSEQVLTKAVKRRRMVSDDDPPPVRKVKKKRLEECEAEHPLKEKTLVKEKVLQQKNLTDPVSENSAATKPRVKRKLQKDEAVEPHEDGIVRSRREKKRGNSGDKENKASSRSTVKKIVVSRKVLLKPILGRKSMIPPDEDPDPIDFLS